MILKSFFRKKTTHIYFLIIFILFSSLFTLNLSINYLKNLKVQKYKDISLLYVSSSNNYLYFLKNEKNLTDIKRCLVFDYEDTIINSKSILVYDLANKALVLNAKDMGVDINDNEIVIGLENIEFLNIKSKDLLNKKINFKFNNKDYTFIIKRIFDNNNRREIIISDTLFNSLLTDNDYKYVATIEDENLETTMLKKLYAKIDGEVHNLTTETYEEAKERENLQKYINILNIAFVLIELIFLITIIIVNKNIIADLNKNIDLEFKMGYKKWQIKKMVLCRLIILHFPALIFSFLITSIIGLVLKSFDLSLIFILMFFILLCDIILILKVKINNY